MVKNCVLTASFEYVYYCNLGKELTPSDIIIWPFLMGAVLIYLENVVEYLAWFFFIFSISFENISYVFLTLIQWWGTIWKNETYKNSWHVYFWLTIKFRRRWACRFSAVVNVFPCIYIYIYIYIASLCLMMREVSLETYPH